MFQQFLIGHVGAVHRIDVAARTDMHAYGLSLLGREAIEDPVVELDEVRKQVASRPGIARIVAGARRPSVKSITTRAAPAAKQDRMSFSHSSTMSSSNCWRG